MSFLHDLKAKQEPPRQSKSNSQSKQVLLLRCLLVNPLLLFRSTFGLSLSYLWILFPSAQRLTPTQALLSKTDRQDRQKNQQQQKSVSHRSSIMCFPCFMIVQTSEVAYIERFGQFSRLAQPGFNLYFCPFERT
jgi:hypothetical protein